MIPLMLVLSRKLNETVVIDGKIRVKIIRVEGDVVKLGIQAPLDVPIHREEIYDEIQKNNREALTTSQSGAPKLTSDFHRKKPKAPQEIPV